MRHLTFFLFLFSFNSFSQDEIKTLESFNVNVGVQILQPASIHYNTFKTTVDGKDFFTENAAAKNTTSDKLYARQFVNGGLGFRILKDKKLWLFKKFNFNVGASFSGGQNLNYDFSENYKVNGDSIWITQNNETEVYTADTLFQIETRYYSELKNVGIYAEYCLSTAGDNSGFSTGLGVLGVYAVENQLFLKQDKLYTTALYDKNNSAAYVQTDSGLDQEIPLYGAQLADSFNKSLRLSHVYSITPYIPIKVHTRLSEDNFLRDFSVELFAKLGYEFQFSASDYRSGRLSYLLGFGLNYYL